MINIFNYHQKIVTLTKKIFFFTTILFLSFRATSQIVTIVNKETKEPLEQVTIFQQKTNNFATTNEKGKAEIKVFKNAEQIEIRFLGFKTKYKNYSEIQKNNFIIELEPSILNMNEIVISASK